MKSPMEWIDRWLEMGIGGLGDSILPQYDSDIISMPYEVYVRDILFFCYRYDRGLSYPKEQALPMVELMQVGI